MSNEPSPAAKVTVSTSPRGAGSPPRPAPLSNGNGNGDKTHDVSTSTNSTSFNLNHQAQRQKQQNGQHALERSASNHSTTSTTTRPVSTTRRTTSNEHNHRHSHSSTRRESRSDSEAETVVLPGKENGPSPSKRRKITHEGLAVTSTSNGQTQHNLKPRPSSSSPLSVTSPKHEDVLVPSSAISPPAPSSVLDAPSSSSSSPTPTPTRSSSNSSTLSSPSLDNSSKIRRAESDSSLSKTSISVSDSHDNTLRKRRPAAEVIVQSRDKKAKRISSPRPSPIEDLSRPHRRKPSAAHSDTHLPTTKSVPRTTRARSIDVDMGLKSASSIKPSCGHNHEHCLNPAKHQKYLLDSETKFSLKPNRVGGTSVFYGFCEKGDVEDARRFWTQHPEFLDMKDNSSNTPLQAASLNGHADVVQFLLDVGAAVGNQNDEGDSPLHDASENSHVEVVELLLKHGASPYSKNKRGNMPIDVVDEDMEEGEQIAKILEIAREKFITPEYPSEDEEYEAPTTAKSVPPQQGNVNERFRAHDRSVQTSDKLLYKSSAKDLTESCAIGELQMVNYFLSSGARVAPQNIFAAAKGGHYECLRVLLGDALCQPDVVIDDMKPGQDTALLVAIGRGNLSTVKALIDDYRVDPTKTFEGKTYTQIAEERHGPYWKAEMETLTEGAEKWRRERGNASSSSKPSSSTRESSKSRKHSPLGPRASSPKKHDARATKHDHADHLKPLPKATHKHTSHGSEDEGTAHKFSHKKHSEKEKDAQKHIAAEAVATKPGRKLVTAREHREGKAKPKPESHPSNDDMDVASPLSAPSTADKGSKRQRSLTPPSEPASSTAPTTIEKPTPKKIKVAKMSSHDLSAQQSNLTESPAAIEKTEDPMKAVVTQPEKHIAVKTPTSQKPSPVEPKAVPKDIAPRAKTPEVESSLTAAQRAKEQEAADAAARKAAETESQRAAQQDAERTAQADLQRRQAERMNFIRTLPAALQVLYLSNAEDRLNKVTQKGILPMRFAKGRSLMSDVVIDEDSNWVTNFQAAIVLGISDLEFTRFPHWPRIPVAKDQYYGVWHGLAWPYLSGLALNSVGYNEDQDTNKFKFPKHDWFWVRVEDVLHMVNGIVRLSNWRREHPEKPFFVEAGNSFVPRTMPWKEFEAECNAAGMN